MKRTALLIAGALALFSSYALAQDDPASDQKQLLSAAQLDQLVAPIALYPDTLLTHVLMASTYPLEVVQADRFAKANKNLKGQQLDDALAKQDWDDSIKALVTTPTVLTTMSDKLDWTEQLGDAVLAQQADIMDAIQRLRGKAQANGSLKTTKQQTVKVEQGGGGGGGGSAQTIVIEPTQPETVYVPYYNPSTVYGTWPYPAYPPYYYPPAPGWVVGGAIASGIAWGAGWAIGNAIWNNNFDWNRGDIHVNRSVNVNNRNSVNWQHNSYHRRGVNYNNTNVRNKYANANVRNGDRNFDFRGHSGNQVLKPDNRPGGDGGRRPGGGGDNRPGGGGDNRPGGGGNRPDLGGGGDNRPGGGGGDNRPGGGGDNRPGGGGNRPDFAGGDHRPGGGGNRPDLGGGGRGNGFDPGDGKRAKDFSNRGQASLGNRGAGDFKGGGRPGGGGGPKFSGGGRPGGGGGAHMGGGRPGGGGGARMGGGGRGGGGGGRGGGGRRSDIRLKEGIVPLARLENGLELYRFRYKGSNHTAYVGVMAQEVQKMAPDAVHRGPDGYLTVDYDRIGAKFMTWSEWQRRSSKLTRN
jgi:hypothetical protein